MRKRISQARSILRKQFNEYLGEDNEPLYPLKGSAKSSKSNDFKQPEAIANNAVQAENQRSDHFQPPNRVNPQEEQPDFGQLKVDADCLEASNFNEKEAIANDYLTLSEQNQKPLSPSPQANRVNQSHQKSSIQVNFKLDRKLLLEARRTWVSIDLNDKILALLAKKEGFLKLNIFNKQIDSS